MWAIVELMGRVRLAGDVTEEEHYGVKMGRIDIPAGEVSEGRGMTTFKYVTQFFGGASVYRVTPCTEEVARQIAKEVPAPISSFDIREVLKAIGVNQEESSNDDYSEDDEQQ